MTYDTGLARRGSGLEITPRGAFAFLRTGFV